jgi:hypothetical protein
MEWSSMIMAWTVNISEFSVKYRRIYSVDNSNGKHRWNIFVGDCGMRDNFLQLSVKYRWPGFVCKTVGIYLKIFKKHYLLIVKKLINQIKLY